MSIHDTVDRQTGLKAILDNELKANWTAMGVWRLAVVQWLSCVTGPSELIDRHVCKGELPSTSRLIVCLKRFPADLRRING